MTRPAPHPASTPRATARRGFNLIEVMVSMGIFVIAFVAVASIFPVAITLQREAVQQVEDDAAVASAEAALFAFGIDVSTDDNLSTVYTPSNPGGGGTQPGTLQPMLDDVKPTAPPGGSVLLPFAEQATRTLGVNPFDADNADNRPYIWVPMVQPIYSTTTPTPFNSLDPTHFRIYLAVLRRNEVTQDPANAQRFSNPRDPKTVASGSEYRGWASDDDEWFPGIKRMENVAAPPDYDPPPVNRTTFRQIPNDDGQGNRLILPFDIFMDENGGVYRAVESTLTSVTVDGRVSITNPVNGNDIPEVLYYAPRPLEDDASDTSEVRPESGRSPLVDVIVFEPGSSVLR